MINKALIFIIFTFLFSSRGDLISYEYKEFELANDIQTELDGSDAGILEPIAIYDIKLYSIIYETIDQFGNVVFASGSICIPDNNDYSFPTYLFGHGTQIKRLSAPSMNGLNVLNRWVATSGYIFIEPDYLGLGISEMLHPYHLKDVTASCVIDMIRASKQFCDQLSEIQYNDQLFLAGYSEGGYATMATVKEMEENLQDEFNITVSFPMAGAYDLSGVMADLMLSEEPYPDPFYLPFFVLSYIEMYSMGVIDDFFLPEYAAIFPDLFSGEYSGGYINSFLPDIPIHMMLPEVVEEFTNNENYPFRVHLEENDLYDWSPVNPMYLFHGIADERVPHENSVVAYDSFLENGSESVYFESLPESFGGHQEAAVWCLLIAFNISEDLKVINLKGDLNYDNLFNVLDVVTLVNVIFNTIDLNSYLSWSSDLNNDQIINVLDVVDLINMVLSE